MNRILAFTYGVLCYDFLGNLPLCYRVPRKYRDHADNRR